ncbi:MAG TPA: DUF262 domain-containing HNH endonuclease family protein [Candidatus Saccharimonadales bacterium]|nr:DUF262 domain-containing HNH endonuclease family protein [Candidatus Saccharimonadales bacterium]
MNTPITAGSSSTKQQTIRDLFDLFRPFQVPAYQRAFAWEHKHVEQFIEDLREQPADKPYYLGHFLLEHGDNGIVYVIDGQQRLTTLTLVFGCVVRLLTKAGVIEPFVDTLRQHYVGRRLNMHFQTVDEDKQIFEDLVFEGTTRASKRTRSQERLIIASSYLEKALSKENSETLVKWTNALTGAHITYFPVNDKIQATQIFTFQNSRGKELTEFEKLKAFLMHQIYLYMPGDKANEAIKRVEHHFSEMYRDMEYIRYLDENGVLRHHDHAYSRHWKMPLENLKADLAALDDGEAKVKEIAKFCKMLAYTFQHVREIEKIMVNDELLADPLILDAGNSWPLLIKLYGIFQEGILKEPDVRVLLRDVEIVLFKMDFQHGSVTNNLVHHAKELRDKPDLHSIRKSLDAAVHKGFGHNRWTFDSDALTYFNGDYHYHRITRYLLWKYENELTNDKDRKVKPGDYLNFWEKSNMESTIEHISAVHPRGTPNTEEFNRQFLNNVGNLVLMPKGMNSSLGNQADEDKKPIYDRSTYNAHREIGEMMQPQGEWTKDKIGKRKEKIVAFICKRWQIPIPAPSSEAHTQ